MKASNSENSEIQAELEVCRHLQKVCRTLRGSKRPELAGPAARWEIKLDEQIAELEGQITPTLPLHMAQKAVAA